MNPLILNVLNAIPAAASRVGGTVLKQAPKAAAKVTRATGGGFDPLNQVPAFFSRFGGSAINAPSVRNVQSLRGVVPAASLGMGGLSTAALDPMLQGSQYIQQQLKGFGLMPEPGRRIGSIPPEDKTGESYRDAELRLSAAARAAGGPSAGGGIGGGNAASSLNGGSFRPLGGTPEERAQAAETARVAQLTAQDPELQRYEKARAAAKTQEEMNAARDIGMAIWARSNPKLAAKVKPGQSGYEVIQNEINAGQMGPVTDLPFDTTKPFSPTPIPPEQQSITYEGVRPAMLGEVTPITGGGFPTQQAAMFERFRQSISPTTPSFQGSPLGTASPLVGNLSYTGSVSPLGTAVEGGDFRSEQAQKLAEMFKKAQFAG